MSLLPSPREQAHNPSGVGSRGVVSKRHYFYQESIIYFSIFGQWQWDAHQADYSHEPFPD